MHAEIGTVGTGPAAWRRREQRLGHLVTEQDPDLIARSIVVRRAQWRVVAHQVRHFARAQRNKTGRYIRIELLAALAWAEEDLLEAYERRNREQLGRRSIER